MWEGQVRVSANSTSEEASDGTSGVTSSRGAGGLVLGAGSDVMNVDADVDGGADAALGPTPDAGVKSGSKPGSKPEKPESEEEASPDGGAGAVDADADVDATEGRVSWEESEAASTSEGPTRASGMRVDGAAT